MIRFFLAFILPFLVLFITLWKENNNNTFLIFFYISFSLFFWLLILVEFLYRKKFYTLFFDKLGESLSYVKNKEVFYIIICTKLNLINWSVRFGPNSSRRIYLELEKNLSDEDSQLVKSFSNSLNENIKILFRYGCNEKFMQYMDEHKDETKIAEDLLQYFWKLGRYEILWIFGVFIYFLTVAVFFVILK